MQVKEGRANFESLGPGTMVVDMTLEDGSKWKGRFFVTPAVRTSLSGAVFNGDFDAGRLKGGNLVGIGSIVAAIGPNGPVFLSFSDDDNQQAGRFEVGTDLQGIVDAQGGGTWERIG
ncbi:hypothetical protein ACE103_35650 [Bradyrhizobium sp. ma5]|jgi:hypothetical protein|uniref:hypothetical protein n=1 Tax=Bradyrhizobium sp. ma5 TaxID=3344828 RepID=UPI0035D46182